MDLKQQLLSDLKEAMKARDALKVNTIRCLTSEIKNKEIDLRKAIGDEEIVSIIASQIKKRKEAIVLFEKGGRTDLSEKESEECRILAAYLPEQISEEELRQRVQEVIANQGLKGPKDLGKVMKTLIPQLKGRADNNLVRRLAGEYLGQ